MSWRTRKRPQTTVSAFRPVEFRELNAEALQRFLHESDRSARTPLTNFKVVNLVRTNASIDAEVEELFNYRSRLTLRDGRFYPVCSCPWGRSCPHVYALVEHVLKGEGITADPGSPPAWASELPWSEPPAWTSEQVNQLRLVERIWTQVRHVSILPQLQEARLIPPSGPGTLVLRELLMRPTLQPAERTDFIDLLLTFARRQAYTPPSPLDALPLTPAAAAHWEQLLDRAEMEAWLARCDPAPSPVTYRRTAAKKPPIPSEFRLRLHRDSLLLEHRPDGKPTFREGGFPKLRTLIEHPRMLSTLAPAQLDLLEALQEGLDGPAYLRTNPLPNQLAARLLRQERILARLVVDDDGEPGFTYDPRPCTWHAERRDDRPDRLRLRRRDADGQMLPLDAVPLPAVALVQVGRRLLEDAPPVPAEELPVRAWEDAKFLPKLVLAGVRSGPEDLPLDLVPLTLGLRITWVPGDPAKVSVQVLACDGEAHIHQTWNGHAWVNADRGRAKHGRVLVAPDPNPALVVLETWGDRYSGIASRDVSARFPQAFEAFLQMVPTSWHLVVDPALQAFLRDPDKAHLEVTVTPGGGGAQDWFDLAVQLRPEDLELTKEEIALLAKADGGWVNLPDKGWRRLDVVQSESARAALDELGLADAPLTAKPQRVHALQLAGAAHREDSAAWRAVRDRLAALAALPVPEPPAALAEVLRPYQRDGFRFLATQSARGLGALLADDMGLGKTLQALAWLADRAAAAEIAGETFRALIVCPKSVRANWVREAGRFTPQLTIADWTGQGGVELPTAGLVVTGYTQLRRQASALGEVAWHAVILDEAQFIKNPDTATAKVASGLHAQHRLLLTGTPIENRTLDLWSLFAFLQPGLFGSQKDFKHLYGDRAGPEAWARLARRIRPFLLRRTKSQVALDLPPRTEEDLTVELEPAQRKLYDAELKETRRILSGLDTAGLRRRQMEVLRRLLRLRQICCAPSLLGDVDAGNAKLDALVESLVPLLEEGHRVLVFSQFVRVLQLISKALTERKISHLMLTGQTENRGALVDQFQSTSGPPVFLLSLRAAGTGLNLTAADYVFLFDPWWNPAVEAQAIDRTHRIGQSRPVIAYRLLAKNTIEDKIRHLQQHKAELARQLVSGDSDQIVLDLDTVRALLFDA